MIHANPDGASDAPETISRKPGPASRHMALAALTLLLVFATITLPGWGLAAETRSANEVTIAQNERIADDLYIAAGTADFQGTAAGDVTIVAMKATISGTIDGTVNLAAGQAEITGTIDGSIRVLSGRVKITGSIGGDVVMAGGQLDLTSSGRIGGNVILAGGTIDLRGTVTGDVSGYAMRVTIGGTHAGNVDINTSNLNILDTARIAGTVTYTSRSDADVGSGAQLTQGITQETQDPWGDGDNPLEQSKGGLLRILWALVAGALLIVAAPRLANQLGSNGKRLLPAVILGVIGLIAIPILVIVLMATVIGFPAGLILVTMFLIALYLTQVFAGMALGRFILPRRWNDGSRGFHLLAMTLGVLLIGATRFIPLPYLHGLVVLLVTIWGIGAAVMLVVPLGRRDEAIAA